MTLNPSSFKKIKMKFNHSCSWDLLYTTYLTSEKWRKMKEFLFFLLKAFYEKSKNGQKKKSKKIENKDKKTKKCLTWEF